MRHKLLTVDDSKTVRIIVRKAFKGYDCETLEAANGAEGLVVAGCKHPDLILLDVTMPVMGGIEMLAKLKADPGLQQIPVMMMLSEEGREAVVKLTRENVRDYLVKPFQSERLVAQAAAIVDLKLTAAARSPSLIQNP